MRASSSVRPPGRQRHVPRLRALALVLGLGAAGVGVLAQPPAVAQTTSTVSPVDLRLNPVVQIGATASALPIGGQTLQVIVSNSGTSPISNQQIVVRVPVTPAVITQVSEQNAPVGVVDPRSGFWYHTIAQLNAGSSVTYVVTWYSPCPGRWPLVARVGERRTSTSVQFVGVSSATCPPDEVASPVVPSYLELPWPPTSGAVATTTTAVAPTSTLTSTPSPAGAAAATTSTTVVTSTTQPLLALPVATTTTVPKSTVKRTTPTTIIICKTVGGRRYCGPQSSVYKPGQKKAVETKPKTTVKKTVKPVKK